MKNQNYLGKFIVIEGLDGSDAIERSESLANWIKSRVEKNTTVHLTREPSDGPIGRDLRLFLNGRMKFDKLTASAMFVTDRMDHIYRENDGILKRLSNGEIVICDRYYLSTYAYQQFEGIDLNWLIDLHEKCLTPDLTFFVDIPVGILVSKFALESREHEFHSNLPTLENDPDNLLKKLESIRNNYNEIITRFKANGESIFTVTGTSPKNIDTLIQSITNKELGI